MAAGGVVVADGAAVVAAAAVIDFQEVTVEVEVSIGNEIIMRARFHLSFTLKC